MNSLTSHTDKARLALMALGEPKTPVQRIQKATQSALLLATAQEADAGTPSDEIASGNYSAAVVILAIASTGRGREPEQALRRLELLAEEARKLITGGRVTPVSTTAKPGRVQ